MAGKDWLDLGNVIIAKVTVCYIRGRLVIASDVGHVGYDVLLGQHLHRQHGNQPKGLPPLVSHQTNRALVHYPVQCRQIIVLAVLQAHKVVLEVRLQLALLFADVREVDEEAGAHVALERLHLRLGGSSEIPDQKMAVFQEAASSDLLGVPRADHLVTQVVQRRGEVSIHALADDGGVKRFGHGVLRALVEKQQRVELNLERIDAKLKLPTQGVHELELHVFATVVGERDETPAVRIIAHFYHLLHICFLQNNTRNCFSISCIKIHSNAHLFAISVLHHYPSQEI